MARALNNKALAKITGWDPALISRWVRRGMPHDVVAGVKLYDEAECRAWRAVNAPEKQPRPAAQLQTSATPVCPENSAPATRDLNDQELALIAALEDPATPELELARAGFKLAGLAVAGAYRKGQVAPQQLEALKKQGEELRRAEVAYLDLARERGELIGRDTAQAVAGEIASRLVNLLSTLENLLANQVEIWHEQPAFWTQPTADRQRQIRAWLEARSTQLRTTSAADIEALIKELSAEAQG